MTDELVVAGAMVEGWSRRVDVRAVDGVIREVADTIEPGPHARVVRAAGGVVLPGLHDHHIHVVATAAAGTSVPAGPPEVRDAMGFERALAAADRRLPAGAWLRAIGYHHSVAGDLDRHALDRFVRHRPVRVQDRTGARWTLNSAGIDAARFDLADGPEVERDGTGHPTGRIHRGDELLRTRLPEGEPPGLAALGAELAARGVTGVTDTTPYTTLAGLDVLAAAARSGGLPQRVVVTGGPELAGREPPPGLEWGPVKLVIDDAVYPPVEEVASGIATAHRHGRTVAIHCVTRAALALAVAAWDEAGARPGDRVEHGSVVPPDLAADLVRLGLTVVTQPGLVAERGDDYLAEVDADDLPYLYPCRSLIDAGIPVMGSTDAPYTRPDPWRAIAAAVDRTTPGGAVIGPDERVSVQHAVGLFTSDPLRPGVARRVAPGAPADLCLLAGGLDRGPIEVRATIRSGRVIWSA